MKKMIYAALALMAITTTGAKAQDKSDSDDRAAKMKEMISKQAENLAEQMKLSDDKTADFKTLYVEYRTKEFELRANGMKNASGKKSKKKDDEMTDAKADSLINASFEMQENELKLKKTYYPKFKSLVGAANAYKVFGNRGQMRRQNTNNNNNGQGGQNFGGQRPGGDFGGGMPGGF